MNAKSMLERESFLETLQKSIEEYFTVVRNETVKLTAEKDEDLNTMCLYLQPTFLASGKPCRKMRELLYGEYNVRGSLIKYLAGKTLVFLVTHTCGLMAKLVIYTNIDKQVLNELMISPCNRSVRFFFCEKGAVDCVVKNGYSNNYMQRQLQFRLENKRYSFIHPVEEYGDRWYRERILYGNPLIRVRNDDDFINGQKKALEYMGQLAIDSFSYIRADEYIDHLQKSICDQLGSFHDNESLMDACHKIVTYVSKQADLSSLSIPTAETHGDFQGGNIWFTKEREILIYDWETHKRRSVWYDAATLYWKLHSVPFGMNYEQLAKTDERYLCNDKRKDYTDSQKIVIAWIIYLENIAFYIDDVSQLPRKYAENNYQKLSEAICSDLRVKGVFK